MVYQLYITLSWFLQKGLCLDSAPSLDFPVFSDCADDPAYEVKFEAFTNLTKANVEASPFGQGFLLKLSSIQC